MSATESRLYKEHPQADLTLISSDGIAFKARKLSLQASSDMFDAMTELGAAVTKGEVPQLQVDATAQVLDMALAYIHNQELPTRSYAPAQLDGVYTLAAKWSCNALLSCVRTLYSFCKERPARSTWDLGARHEDQILLDVSLKHMLTDQRVLAPQWPSPVALIDSPEDLRATFGSWPAFFLYSAKYNLATQNSEWRLASALISALASRTAHGDCDILAHGIALAASAGAGSSSPQWACEAALGSLSSVSRKGNPHYPDCPAGCLQRYIKGPLRAALAEDTAARR